MRLHLMLRIRFLTFSWPALFPPYRRLQGPGLQARYLKNLRCAKSFLVNDPASEQFGCVFGNVPRWKNFHTTAQSDSFLQRQFAILQKGIVGLGQCEKKVGWRNRLRTDKHAGRHAALSLQEVSDIQSGVAKSGPVNVTQRR